MNFDPDSKPSRFRPPHKTKSIMIPTLKSSQLRSPTLKSRLFRPSTQQSILMPTLKPCHFRAVLLCALYMPGHVLVIQQQYISYNYEYQLALFLTFPYTVKPRKYCASIHRILDLATWHLHNYVWCWWPDFVTFHSSCTSYFLVSYIGRKS